MGNKVILIIVLLLVATGIIISQISTKHHKATEKLYEHNYAIQAKHLANTVVRMAINDLNDLLDTDPSPTTYPIYTRQDTQDFNNIKGASVTMTTYRDSYSPDGLVPNETEYATGEIPEGNHLIVATAFIESPSGAEYMARVHSMYQHGIQAEMFGPQPFDPDVNPPHNDDTGDEWIQGDGHMMIELENDELVLSTSSRPNPNFNSSDYAGGFLENDRFRISASFLQQYGFVISSNRAIRICGSYNFDLTVISTDVISIEGNIIPLDNPIQNRPAIIKFYSKGDGTLISVPGNNSYSKGDIVINRSQSSISGQSGNVNIRVEIHANGQERNWGSGNNRLNPTWIPPAHYYCTEHLPPDASTPIRYRCTVCGGCGADDYHDEGYISVSCICTEGFCECAPSIEWESNPCTCAPNCPICKDDPTGICGDNSCRCTIVLGCAGCGADCIVECVCPSPPCGECVKEIRSAVERIWKNWREFPIQVNYPD